MLRRVVQWEGHDVSELHNTFIVQGLNSRKRLLLEQREPWPRRPECLNFALNNNFSNDSFLDDDADYGAVDDRINRQFNMARE
jgi:hypothetical protein